jgi:hypothetical protein
MGEATLIFPYLPERQHDSGIFRLIANYACNDVNPEECAVTDPGRFQIVIHRGWRVVLDAARLEAGGSDASYDLSDGLDSDFPADETRGDTFIRRRVSLPRDGKDHVIMTFHAKGICLVDLLQVDCTV